MAHSSTIPTSSVPGLKSPSKALGGTLLRGSAKVLGHVLAWCLGTLFAVVIQAVLSGFAHSATVDVSSDSLPMRNSLELHSVDSLLFDEACVQN